jgi:hypothetical protein
MSGRDLRGSFTQLQAVAGRGAQRKKQRERQVSGCATEVHFHPKSKMLTKRRLGIARRTARGLSEPLISGCAAGF